jgi:hypothetical protein
MEQPKIDQYIDTQNIVFEYIKHITTLNTGSVVLLATFLEKLFVRPVWKVLVLVAFSSFILSTIFLSLSGFGIIRSIRTPDNVSEELVSFTSWTFILGMITFLLAVSSLTAFAMRNFL